MKRDSNTFERMDQSKQTGAPYIGRSMPRPEDPRLLSGHGEFVDDIRLPDQAYAAVLRSPHAHALITSIDVAQARMASGVLGVYTYSDVKDRIKPITPNWRIADPLITERPVLADGCVRMVGEPVAFVVAESRQAAFDALELIEVTYESLEAVVDEEDACKPGAPQLFPHVPNNRALLYKVDGGDYVKAAAAADCIVRTRMLNNRVIPSPIEPRAVCALYEPFDDKLTVFTTSQMPHMHRRWIAENLAWPEHKLRVMARDVGGGFGCKMHLYPEELLCPFAAIDLGRPVKWTETRSESHVSTTHGRAHTEYIEVAVRNDGLILGMKLESFANVGAYLSNMATGVPTFNCASQVTGPYRIDNFQASTHVVLTNTQPVDAYRGAGRPEAAYIMERTMDAIAAHLKLDRAAVRKLNFIKKDEFPYVPYNNPLLRVEYGDYAGCLDDALRMINHEDRVRQQIDLRKEGRYIGIGFAAYTHFTGVGPSERMGLAGFDRGGWESAQVRVHSDGKVTLFSGSMPTGQGHAVTFAQIVADELQIFVGDVDVVQGDTDRVLAGNGTYNSRSAALGGSAAKICASMILAKAKCYAAAALDLPVEQIAYVQGLFRTAGQQDDGETLTFAQVARMAALAHVKPDGVTPGLDETYFYDPSSVLHPCGVHAVVVEVDLDTGFVTLLDYAAVDDIGSIINPLIAEGQVHGSVVQGIGQALHEQVKYDSTGQLLTGSLLDYALPKADQLCSIKTGFRVNPTVHNPLGAKGVGEAGCVPGPPALVSAVCDALAPFGISHIDMPMTPPRIWHHIQQALITSGGAK